MKPVFRKIHKGMGRYLLVPIDYNQTEDGLTICTKDIYDRVGEEEWVFSHREIRIHESHATKWEYASCPTCTKHSKREYGAGHSVKRLKYEEIEE